MFPSTSLPLRFAVPALLATLGLSACFHEEPVDAPCEVDGMLIPSGETFPSTDGCNTCSCFDGFVACTERACVPEPEFCGGIAGFGCPDGQFCNFPIETNCGSGDQAGSCTQVPELCSAEINPVCGCDGVTYSNACAAETASVSISALGPCEGSGEECSSAADCPLPPCQCIDFDGDGSCDEPTCPTPECIDGFCVYDDEPE